jgi:hypothetical protein
MSENRFELVVDLPKSDGFHTQGDLHLAEIVKARMQKFLDGDPAFGYPGCTVRITAK